MSSTPSLLDALKTESVETSLTSTNSPTPPTPSSPVAFEIKILFDPKLGKVLFATTDSTFVQLLYGFMSFPISALSLLDAGAITQMCESLKKLQFPDIRDDFDKTHIFKAKPTTCPLPDPKLMALMNGDCSSDYTFCEDDFKHKSVYSCKSCKPFYVTRNPETPCYKCSMAMNNELIYVRAAAKAWNDEAGGGYVNPNSTFKIFDNMDIKLQNGLFDILDLAEGYDMSELESITLPITEESVCILFIVSYIYIMILCRITSLNVILL